MAFRAKDRATLQPSQPSALKTREPGLCPNVCPSRLLLSIEQTRMSLPGFPGVHPISAVGQSPKMAVPAPPSDSGSQTEPAPSAEFTWDPTSGRGRKVFWGRLLAPGTCLGSEGPVTSLSPRPGSQAGRGGLYGPGPTKCATAEVPPSPPHTRCPAEMGPALPSPMVYLSPGYPSPSIHSA